MGKKGKKWESNSGACIPPPVHYGGGYWGQMRPHLLRPHFRPPHPYFAGGFPGPRGYPVGFGHSNPEFWTDSYDNHSPVVKAGPAAKGTLAAPAKSAAPQKPMHPIPLKAGQASSPVVKAGPVVKGGPASSPVVKGGPASSPVVKGGPASSPVTNAPLKSSTINTTTKKPDQTPKESMNEAPKREGIPPGHSLGTVTFVGGRECAVDVCIAPEVTDGKIYEGLVFTPITQENENQEFSGQISTIIGADPVKLPFRKSDTKVTLLPRDRVQFQIVRNVVNKTQRATNIKPKIPQTFILTKESRETGLILSKTDKKLTIMSEKYDNMFGLATDSLTDDNLKINDLVEFTVLTVGNTMKAVRFFLIKQAEGSERWKPVNMEANIKTEKYEGVVLRVPKKPVTPEEKEKYEESDMGLLVYTVEGTEKQLLFKPSDVTTKATMMNRDKVQFNVSTSILANKEFAVNVQILPETFLSETEEQRKIGIVDMVGEFYGLIKTLQGPKLRFSKSEVMEAQELLTFEKVEFTAMKKDQIDGGTQAIRIRRLNKNIFTSVPKLEALKDKKKMTIKLLADAKDTKTEVKTPEKISEAVNVDYKNDEETTAPTSADDQNKANDVKQEKAKDERSRSRSRESNRRSRSWSQSSDSSSSRSRSHKKHRSSSRERRGGRYKDEYSPVRSKEKKRSRSRSKSRDRSTRKRSHSPRVKSEPSARQSGSKDSSTMKRSESSRDKSEPPARQSGSKDSSTMKRSEGSRDKSEPPARQSGSNDSSTMKRSESSRDKSEPPAKKSSSKDPSTTKRSNSPRDNSEPPAKKSSSKDPSTTKRSNSPRDNSEPPAKQSSSKDSSSSKTDRIPDIDDELARKKQELLELQELIARTKAIVSKEEEKAKKIEPEVDENSGMKMSTVWTPDLKPVKSILKKQSGTFNDAKPQATIIQESSPQVVKAENVEIAVEYHQNRSGPRIPGLSLLESPFQELTHSESEKMSVPLIMNLELMRKKKQWTDLDEAIAFKKSLIAQEQMKVEEPEIDSDEELYSTTDVPFLTPTENSWFSTGKPNPQPPKSILKKTSEIFPLQRESTSAEEYRLPTQQDATFSHVKPRATAASFFDQSSSSRATHSGSLGVFNQVMSEPVAAPKFTEKPNLCSQFVPRSLVQASSLRSSDPNFMQYKSFENQLQQRQSPPRASHKPPSPTSSDKKAFINFQMERLVGALNKANSSVLNTLFEESRKDLSLWNPTTPVQQEAAKSIPFMDEEYDPFQNDEDYQASCSNFEQEKDISNEFGQDDLLPHERAVQDIGGFSRLVGMKCDETSARSPHEHLMAPNKRSVYNEVSTHLTDQWSQYEINMEQYSKQQKVYIGDRSLSSEHCMSEPNESLAKEVDEEKDGSADGERLQNILKCVGLTLDTMEVNKLADRTQERLYGKTVDQQREHSLSLSERRGSSSRADSSESESLRSVSPAQSSNRKVYMSSKELKYSDPHHVDLKSIKRTIQNVPHMEEEEHQRVPVHIRVNENSPLLLQSQVAQNPTLAMSQNQIDNQPFWGMPHCGIFNSFLHAGFVGNPQPVARPVMPPFSSYASFSPENPSLYGVPPQGLMQPHYNPLPNLTPIPPLTPAPSPAQLFSMSVAKANRPTRTLKTIEIVSTVPASTSVATPAANVNEENQKLADIKYQHTAKLTEEDIKAKRMKRLEQFNLRMKMKKEKQMATQRSQGQNKNATPGRLASNGVKNVWIIGHSLVFWAEKRAKSPEFGMQLGMHADSVRIWWKGTQGMRWSQLLSILLQLKGNWPKPDVLIIHLGGNDISTIPMEVFVKTVAKDMTSLKSIFPECLLVFSAILSRQSWVCDRDSKSMDIIRGAVNELVCKIMLDIGGNVLNHDNIQNDLSLYRPDGVHLSGNGIDLFNQNLQDFLEKWDREYNQTEDSD
ncbi:hypothetical protein DNTS_010962 [Danionella cerebrum]|uniref:Cold shock domain-containing protein n=1 Tax=Danionella cerebrum TaxID=2873325 RepID=A0A553QZK6_9TELE|nr:hypothetical protein DNTS_010962 [Danionella translucida]